VGTTTGKTAQAPCCCGRPTQSRSDALKHSIEDDRRLGAQAINEEDYYESQTSSGAPLEFLGIFVAVIMAIGGGFAAMNTMYAAVALRAKEIGTLRTLGFSETSILASFLIESILLSVLAGILGCLLALPLNWVTTGVGNFASFSEIAFQFHTGTAMDRPSSGEVLILNQNLASLNSRELARWRNAHIGFIFQSFNLIPVLTALENVALPLKLTGLNAKEQGEHATVALNLVGLGDRLHHFPRQLSGGQERRVAIARAIVTDPDFILADEPTGNLDATSANDVLTLLSALNQEHGKTILLVTHDPHAAHYASIVRYLDKGLLLPEGQLPKDWIDAAAPASFQSKAELGSEAQQ
jgi:putative ABC transport system ATP-binding protein